VHLERPEAFARAISGFLMEIGARERDEEEVRR